MTPPHRHRRESGSPERGIPAPVQFLALWWLGFSRSSRCDCPGATVSHWASAHHLSPQSPFQGWLCSQFRWPALSCVCPAPSQTRCSGCLQQDPPLWADIRWLSTHHANPCSPTQRSPLSRGHAWPTVHDSSSNLSVDVPVSEVNSLLRGSQMSRIQMEIRELGEGADFIRIMMLGLAYTSLHTHHGATSFAENPAKDTQLHQG